MTVASPHGIVSLALLLGACSGGAAEDEESSASGSGSSSSGAPTTTDAPSTGGDASSGDASSSSGGVPELPPPECGPLSVCGQLCVDLSVDPGNCGQCGVSCVIPHASPACSGNACAIASCDPGWTDCDGDPQNGCELVPLETYPTPDTVDWAALWELIEALIDTGEVSVIFLDHRLQERLYWAARRDGKTAEELAPIIHWPRKDKIWEVIVRHSRNHKGHIHVRLLCGPDEARCTPRRDETLARRGWIEPHPSGKESREGARARREAWLLARRGVDGEIDGGEPGDDEP